MLTLQNQFHPVLPESDLLHVKCIYLYHDTNNYLSIPIHEFSVKVFRHRKKRTPGRRMDYSIRLE